MSKTTLPNGTTFVHAGEVPDQYTGAIAPPLIRSKTYRQQFGEEAQWKYSRGSNPTRTILEQKLGIIAGGQGRATVFSSGVAATAMIFMTLNPGDHILMSREVYGGTYRLITQVLNRFGLKADFVDFSDQEAVKQSVTEQTRYFFVETPSNPSLHVTDLEGVATLSRELNIPYIADLTFAPPVTTPPFGLGAETVIYSLSKYFAGHNDVVGGAVITQNPELDQQLRFFQSAMGAILSPDECYRVIQGLKTLHLRWQRVSQTAQIVAEYLESQPFIKRVLYPGLPSHPGHKVAAQQMSKGFGSVISFETVSTDLTTIKKFVNELQAHILIYYGESLASPETILAYPASMSHRSLSKVERLGLGISDSFFRLSVGFEESEDIISELERGMQVLANN